jgi:hypothetical protein
MDGAKRSLITHIKSSEDLSEDAEGEFGRGAIDIQSFRKKMMKSIGIDTIKTFFSIRMDSIEESTKIIGSNIIKITKTIP